MEILILQRFADILAQLHAQQMQNGIQTLRLASKAEVRLCVLLCQCLDKWYLFGVWKLSVSENDPLLLVRSMKDWKTECSLDTILHSAKNVVHEITSDWIIQTPNPTRIIIYRKCIRSICRENDILSDIIDIVTAKHNYQQLDLIKVLPEIISSDIIRIEINDRGLFEREFWKLN